MNSRVVNSRAVKWYEKWFNEDYLKLYAHRDSKEAEEQVQALIQLLELKGDEEILDLGCGAGRHSIALANRGFSVVGVDISKPLLEKARQENSSTTFLECDMRQLSGSFDVVLSLFTSFGYFEDDQVVLDQVASVLRPEGKFLLDTLQQAKVGEPTEVDVEGEKVQLSWRREGDLISKKIVFPGREYEERVRLYSRDQLEAMLKKAGLSVVAVYSDFSGAPWSETSERQLYRCRNPG